MAFKMRSGNKVSFKNMGSSPAKQRTIKNPTGDNLSLGSEDTTNDNIHIPIDPNSTPGAKPKEPKYNLKELEKAIEARKKRKKTSPAKQREKQDPISPQNPLSVGLPYSKSYLESLGISMEDYKKLINSREDDQKRKSHADKTYFFKKKNTNKETKVIKKEE